MSDQVPVPNTADGENILAYVAALFDLADDEIPTDAIVVLGYIGTKNDDDPIDSGSYWDQRLSTDGTISQQVWLLEAAKHALLHFARDTDWEDEIT